jgi:methionine-rich copper-binding protein CopC
MARRTRLHLLARAIVGSTILIGSASLAHTHLVRSSPADHAALTSAPSEASFTFAEPVILTAARLESSTGDVTTLTLPTAGSVAEIHMRLPPLVPGHYRLRWRATSADGHVMSGDINFAVLAPAPQ